MEVARPRLASILGAGDCEEGTAVICIIGSCLFVGGVIEIVLVAESSAQGVLAACALATDPFLEVLLPLRSGWRAAATPLPAAITGASMHTSGLATVDFFSMLFATAFTEAAAGDEESKTAAGTSGAADFLWRLAFAFTSTPTPAGDGVSKTAAGASAALHVLGRPCFIGVFALTTIPLRGTSAT